MNPNNPTNNITNNVQQAAKKVSDTATREYPEIKDIKENVAELKSNTAGLVRHVYQDGREVLASTGERVSSRMDTIRDAGREELKRLESRVRANPTQGLAIAFAVGLLTSFIFGRK